MGRLSDIIRPVRCIDVLDLAALQVVSSHNFAAGQPDAGSKHGT